MQDRIFEHQSFPQPFDLLRFRKPLVLAPHPDDEIFGCAGLMLMWLRSGVRARVVVLTDGLAQHDGDAELGAPSRIAESEAAAALLGHELTTWKLQDRELRCDESLIERMVEAIVEHAPDVVLVPALTEPHPDHQATTLAVACALARLQPQGLRPDLLLYESGGALTHPNLLIDISEVVDTKTQAMACFRSQEGFQPYASRILARDHFRAMPLGPSAQAAEGFQLLPVREKGWPAVLPALEPLYLHGRGQAASEEDQPLVSVLIRTAGDAHLEKTLASVCAQTYPRLEVVLVDAANQKVEPAGLPARQDIKRIWVGAGKTLSRPEAANAALDAAGGEWLIFLDDDDLWTPEHVAKLVGAQRASGQVRAVHTDVQVIDEHGRELTRYDQAFQAERMAFTNVLPIHSVLFNARLVRERGCRFDEQLPVLEDWDFWLQVGEVTDITHVPGVSAFYRYRDRSGLESPDHAHHQRQWRDKVLERWMQRRGAEATLSAIRWYVKSLDERQQQLEAAQRQCSAVEHQHQAWALERHTWTTERLQLEDARTQALEQLGAAVQDVHRAYAAWEEDRGRWEQERQAWALERHTWTTERLQLEAARTQALEQLGAAVQDVHRAYAAWEEDRGRWEQERQAWALERHTWTTERLQLEAARTQALEQLGAAVQDVHRAYAAWEEDRGRWEQERQAWEMQRGRWEEERAQWNAERGHLQLLNGQMSADLAEQRRLVDALRATRSWRWTRPLRWLASRWQRATHLD